MTRDKKHSKVAVITGATKGLGQALALEFAQNGYYVLGLFHSDAAAAQSTQRQFASQGWQGDFIKLDITQLPEKLPFVDGDWANLEKLILINNACAPFHPKPMHLLEWEEIQQLFEVAVKGSFLCVKALIRFLVNAKSAYIINILSSAIERTPPKGFCAYTIAKSALQGLSGSLASEYSARGVKVFSVSPGFMETALTLNWDWRFRQAIADQTSPESMLSPQIVAKRIYDLTENSQTRGGGENYVLA